VQRYQALVRMRQTIPVIPDITGKPVVNAIAQDRIVFEEAMRYQETAALGFD
jgi:hypothetical protein